MIREHAQALWSLAEAGGTPPAVHRGTPPTGAAPPYAVVWINDVDPEDGPSRTINGDVGSYRAWATVISVGETQDSAVTVAGIMRGRLLGVIPTIAGRQCLPIRRVDGRDVQPDRSTSITRYERADVYRLDSEPA